MKTVKTKISRWKIGSIASAGLAFCLVVGCASKDEVFEQVDQLPTFGKDSQYVELYEFIGKNLRYPEEARNSKIEGKVFAEFVVEKDGSLSNVKAVKGIGHGCDEEVVRVIKSLPAEWKPGEKNGKIVRTKFTLPILFQLSEPKKAD
jgi:protein TonB